MIGPGPLLQLCHLSSEICMCLEDGVGEVEEIDSKKRRRRRVRKGRRKRRSR